MKVETAVELILEEYHKTVARYPYAFHSHHEGYAVIKEEIDELWDAIKTKKNHPNLIKALREEATQVAAMAIRFLVCFVPEEKEEMVK